MGQCIIRRTGAFKAFINVTATPSSVVTVTFNGATQTATANSNGLASFTVKKKGTYTITSDATGSQTANVAVSVNKQTYTANIVGRFTITLTPQTINGNSATTVSANRTSSPYAGASTGALTSGAYIYYGDVLTLTGAVTSSTIYNAVTFNVNSAAFTSGSSHTVTGNVTAAATTSVRSYTMTITKQAGVTLTVTKTGSQYAGNGVNSTWTAAGTATVYYGDVLDVAFSNANTTVYASVACTVAGTARSTGYDHTVTGNFTIAATHTVKSFTMTITKTAGVNLTVTKTSSPYQGSGVNSTWTAAGTATVYYGDVFDVAFSNANTTVYASVACTVAGTARSSGYDHTATAAFTIAATHTVKSFTMTITKTAGVNLTVTKTSSQYAGSGVNSKWTAAGTATVYYGDVFDVAFSNANTTIYASVACTVAGTARSSGYDHTATAAFTIAATHTVKTITLTANAGANSTIVLARTASQYAGASNNNNLITKTGASGTVNVYYGDKIKWTYSVGGNYNIGTHTIAGTARDSGYETTYTANTTFLTTANIKTISLSFFRNVWSNNDTSKYVRYDAYYTVNIATTCANAVGKTTTVASAHRGTSSYSNISIKIDSTNTAGVTLRVYWNSTGATYNHAYSTATPAVSNASTQLTANTRFYISTSGSGT